MVFIIELWVLVCVCVYECVCVISTSHCNRPPTTTRSLGLTQSFPEHFLHLDKNSLQLKTLKTQNRAALFVFRPFLCRFELNNIRLDTKICYNPHWKNLILLRQTLNWLTVSQMRGKMLKKSHLNRSNDDLLHKTNFYRNLWKYQYWPQGQSLDILGVCDHTRCKYTSY